MAKKGQQKPFEELSKHELPLRLEWIGGVTSQSSDPRSCLIECYFSPISDSEKKYLTNEQFRVLLAIGYLPNLYIGQRYEKGYQVPLQEWEVEKLRTLEICFHPQRFPPIEKTLGEVSQDCRLPMLNSAQLDKCKKSSLKELSVLSLSSSRNTIIKVLLPEQEIIRFYLCTSTYLTQVIYCGDLCNSQWKDVICNTLHEVPTLEESSKSARFVYKRKFKLADVPVISRILFDQTEQALRGAQRVFNTRQLAMINQSASTSITYPRTYFPVNELLNLKVLGRWRRLQNEKYIFQVERILSCSSSYPFKHLSFVNELHAGGEPADHDAPTAFEGATVSNDTNYSDDGLSRSRERPRINSPEEISESETREFLGFDSVTSDNNRLRSCTHRSAGSFSSSPNSTPSNSSTGTPTYAPSSSGRVNVVDNSGSTYKHAVELEQFEQAIELIQAIKPTWRITKIPVGTLGKNTGLSYLPLVPCEVRKEVQRKFSFIDDAKKKRRRLICAEICIPKTGYFYIFEMERRVRVTNECISYKEELPIALIHNESFSMLNRDDFDKFLVKTVIHKTWQFSSSQHNMIKHDIKHTLSCSEADSLAERIIDRICAL